MSETPRQRFESTSAAPPAVWVSVVGSIGWIAINSVVTVITLSGRPAFRNLLAPMIVSFVVALGIVVLVQVAIFRGHNWARIVMSALAVFGLVTLIQGIVGGKGTGDPLQYAALTAAIGAVVFIWLPSSSRFFAAARNERRARSRDRAYEHARRLQPPRESP